MYIYLITNTVNGKQYVGKTERTVTVRWSEHCADSQRAPHLAPLLYRAMRKYGTEVFTVATLEDGCQNRQQLDACECFWIAELHTAEGGYNLTLGGTGGKPNAETLQKLRKPKTAEHRLHCSEAARRRGTAHMQTAEARNRKGLKLRGRVFSAATLFKMSLSAKKRAAANPAHLEIARGARLPQIQDTAGRFVSRADGR